METMSQFTSEKDLWKAKCLRFAKALNFLATVTQENLDMTCLEDEDMEKLLEDINDARCLLRDESKDKE